MNTLLTPPHTVARPSLADAPLLHHTNKENVPPSSPTPRTTFPPSPKSSPRRTHQKSSFKAARVLFSQVNRHHPYSTQIKSLPSSRMTQPPRKSSLKLAPAVFTPVPEPGPSKRETTPEPDKPLENPDFLATPINRLIGSLTPAEPTDLPTSQHDLTEAYVTLGARLRAHFKAVVPESSPALTLLRENEAQLAQAFARELERPLQEPIITTSDEESSSLDTDDGTEGKPKKRGVTAAQITYARDAFVLTQTTIRTVTVILSTKVLYDLFSDASLTALTTALLAIPLAEKLYLPNARKTTMLTMWALQNVRIPVRVLEPLADDFVLAMTRAIDGKLGKEGKKGAGCEALTAIHNMCRIYPSVFLPRIHSLVLPVVHRCTPSSGSSVSPSGNNLSLRATAALGGIALGLLNWIRVGNDCAELKAARDRLASIIGGFFDNGAEKAEKLSDALARAMTPGSADQENPAWAVSVITPIIVLLGATYFSSPGAVGTVMTCLKSGMQAPAAKQQQNSLRPLTRMCSAAVVWAAASAEGRFDEGLWSISKQFKAAPVGLCTVAALLAVKADKDREVKVALALDVVRGMIKDGQTPGIHIFSHLVAPASASSPPAPWFNDTVVARQLLDGTINALPAQVKDILDNQIAPTLLEGEEVGSGPLDAPVLGLPVLDDLRPLEIDEVRSWVEDLLGIWEMVVRKISFPKKAQQDFEDDSGVIPQAPPVVFATFEGILKAQVDRFHDSTISKSELRPFIDGLASIFSRFTVPGFVADFPRGIDEDDKPLVALSFARQLWTICKDVFGSSLLISSLRRVPDAIVRALLDPTSIPPDSFDQWSDFLADVLVNAPASILKTLCSGLEWEDPTTQQLWHVLAQKVVGQDEWDAWTWEDGAAVLGVPFSELSEEPISISLDSWEEWEALLDRVISKAASDGRDQDVVLVKVAEALNNCGSIDLQTSLRTITAIIQRIEFPQTASSYSYRTPETLPPQFDVEVLGQGLCSALAVVNNVLVRVTPSDLAGDLQDLDAGLGMLNHLLPMMRKLPGVYAVVVLESLQEGLCAWLRWEEGESGLSVEQYNEKLVSIYVAALQALQDASPSSRVLHTLQNFFASVFQGPSLPDLAIGAQAFQSFWMDNYQTLDQKELVPYPDVLKPILRSLLAQSDEIDAPGLSFGSDHSSSVVPEGEDEVLPAETEDYFGDVSAMTMIPAIAPPEDEEEEQDLDGEVLPTGPVEHYSLECLLLAAAAQSVAGPSAEEERPLVSYESNESEQAVLDAFVNFTEAVVPVVVVESPVESEEVPDSQEAQYDTDEEEEEDAREVDSSLELISPFSPVVGVKATEAPPSPTKVAPVEEAPMLISEVPSIFEPEAPFPALALWPNSSAESSPKKAAVPPPAATSSRKRVFFEAVELPTLASLNLRPMKQRKLSRSVSGSQLAVADDVFGSRSRSVSGPSRPARSRSELVTGTPAVDAGNDDVMQPSSEAGSDDAPVGFEGTLMSSALRHPSRKAVADAPQDSPSTDAKSRRVNRTFSAPNAFFRSRLHDVFGPTDALSIEELKGLRLALHDMQAEVDVAINTKTQHQ